VLGLVVIPARNEAANIGLVLEELAAQGLGLPVLVIDDGSTDATGEIATAHGALVVTHLVNLGYSRALLTGMRYAERSGFDFCLTLDADGQHDPSSLKHLIDRAGLSDRPDLVVGSRFLGKCSERTPWVRRVGMRIFSGLTALVAGRRITDTTCGLRLWSRPAMEEALSAAFGDLHSEMIIYAIWRGLVVAEVPVEIRHRTSGESMYDLVASIAYPFRTLLAVLVLAQRASRPKRS
jgi:glycosyltransferase involved in cell wall biosynthesis